MTEYLSVPSGKIAYDFAGSKEAPAIVLIHEAIADRRMWDREFETLDKRYCVVRYDLRGYGGSSPSEEEFSSVEDLKALLDHLKLERPLIVGASMGGRIALDFVIAHPGNARSLLLISPGFSGMDYPMFPDGIFDVDEKACKAAYEAYKADRVDEAIEHLRGLWGAALKGKDLEDFRSMVRENQKEVFLDRSGQHERPVEPKASTMLSTINIPGLILVGDRDNPAQPHIARYLADHIPGAKMRMVPGADHLLNLTAPEAFDEAVEEMMRS
jgi:3-oxoadipate enol-lactonase